MTSKYRLIIIFSVFVVLVISGQLTGGLGDYGLNNISPIERVEIEGEFENISHDSVRDEVVAVIDGGYFSLDLDAIKKTLMGLPWVDDVSIRREWPSGLRIKIKEKNAVAYWNDDAMISDRGGVFRPGAIKNELSLPKLRGPEGLHNKMWRFLSALEKDFSSMGFEIVDLTLDDRRAWSFHFLSKNIVDEVEVKLGRNHAEERLIRFVYVFSNMNDFNLKNIAVIDFRYPNGFAIKTKNNIATKHVIVREA